MKALISIQKSLKHWNSRAQRGFTMVEVVLALGVCSFSLLAIAGLLTTAIGSNQDAVQQTVANSILSAVTTDLRSSSSKGSLTTRQFTIPLPGDPTTSSSKVQRYVNSAGRVTTDLSVDSRFLLTINFLPNGASSQAATFAKVQITWPAAVSEASKAIGSVQTLVVLDRN